MRLQIRMFGKLSLEPEAGNPLEFESRKAQELLCYLLINRSRPYTRETLAEIIWGETTPERAKKYLRQALWQIQSPLSTNAGEHSVPLILADAEWVQINPEADYWLDVAEFEEVYLSVRGQQGKELEAEAYQTLKKTVTLYQGNILEGWYEDWCLFERERFQNMYLTMLDKLMSYCEAHYAYEEALDFGEIILRYDIARERTHRRMVRIYYMAGERTAALRQYERCVTTLQEELGVKPAQKTVELYEQICQDYPKNIEQTPLPNTGKPSNGSDSHLLQRLQELEKIIADFHNKVSQELRTLEENLRQ